MAIDQRLVLLHLSLINQVGPATIEKLVQVLSLEHVSNLYRYTLQDLCALTGLSENIAAGIISGLADTKLLEKERELLERFKLSYITLYDPEYPLLLKSIYLPPPVLYIKGVIKALHAPAIALVGARKADAYGMAVINQIVPELIAQGYTIVSGGALGIDTYAHMAALRAGGSTVAVLGSGLLRPYPTNNAQLFENIARSDGCVISPFSLTCGALAEHFPARNRIISGLSALTVVVQAAQKSGALITARYALEQGREVGAIPGPITNNLSAGCHKLLSEGAAVITGAQDICALLQSTAFVFHNFSTTISKPNVQSHVLTNTAEQILSSEQRVLVCARTPVSFDELLVHTALSNQELQTILCELQLDGRIDQNAAGLWYIL